MAVRISAKNDAQDSSSCAAVVWMVSYPLPPGESFSRVHGVSLAFVLALESHLCHKTGVLYWALVSMLRACIDLRVIHSSGKAPRLTPAQLIAEQV